MGAIHSDTTGLYNNIIRNPVIYISAKTLTLSLDFMKLNMKITV